MRRGSLGLLEGAGKVIGRQSSGGSKCSNVDGLVEMRIDEIAQVTQRRRWQPATRLGG